MFCNDTLSKKYLNRPDYSTDIVDVACGSGQLTTKLLSCASSLLGIDTSETQIEQAIKIFSKLSSESTEFK